MRSLVPLHHMRRNFAFRELSHTSSQLLLFFRKREFHGRSFPLSVFSILNQSTIYSTFCWSPLCVCRARAPLLHSRTCAAAIFSRFLLQLSAVFSFILSTAKPLCSLRSIRRSVSHFGFSRKRRHSLSLLRHLAYSLPMSQDQAREKPAWPFLSTASSPAPTEGTASAILSRHLKKRLGSSATRAALRRGKFTGRG